MINFRLILFLFYSGCGLGRGAGARRQTDPATTCPGGCQTLTQKAGGAQGGRYMFGISGMPGNFARSGSIWSQGWALSAKTCMVGLKLPGSSRLPAITTTKPLKPVDLEMTGAPQVGQNPREDVFPESVSTSKNLTSPVTLMSSSGTQKAEHIAVPLARWQSRQ